MGSKEKGKGGLGFYSSSSASVEESIDVAREWRNAQAIPLTVTRHGECCQAGAAVPGGDQLCAGSFASRPYSLLCHSKV